MDVEAALERVNELVLAQTGKPLNDLQTVIVRGVWQGNSYQKIHEDYPHNNYSHLKDVGSKLCKSLSKALGVPVGKKSFRATLERYSHLRLPAIESVAVQPEIAANNRGIEYLKDNSLIEAIKQFELAIQINPDHAPSYYNLGWGYERIGDFNRAIALYREAARRGFAAAWCNLARLHVVEDKNYTLAVEICWQGLKLVKEEKVEDDKIVKAALFTYLAWAWMKQGRHEEALEKLQEAIQLDRDRASARCLMAQVLDNLGSDREVLETSWKICLECAKSDRRDEDVWIGMARRRIKELSRASPPDGNLD